MKKCKGCGVTLQYDNPQKLGYILKKDGEYCQRCFRLSHYGDIDNLHKNPIENIEILNDYLQIDNAVFVLIVDCFEALFLKYDKILDYFKDKELIIIINKIDLLPKNINEEKINKLFSNALSFLQGKTNITCLLTYKNDTSFNELFFQTLENLKYQKAIFVGRANAGKSSLINKLCQNSDLTTSIYPGTSLFINEINLNNYTFIDTPGLIDEENFTTYIDNKLLKKILPLKTIKAQNFQLYSKQSYNVEGLLVVDIMPKNKANVLFMINNNLEVHRTKMENSTNYLERNMHNFDLKLLPLKEHQFIIEKNKVFFFKGLGLIKINGDCRVNIHINDKIRIYKNEVNI